VYVPHLANYIFFIFINELGLGIFINLAWLQHHFHLVLDETTVDLNPQPYDHESSLVSTRPDFRSNIL